jgi:hypothetical protein
MVREHARTVGDRLVGRSLDLALGASVLVLACWLGGLILPMIAGSPDLQAASVAQTEPIREIAVVQRQEPAAEKPMPAVAEETKDGTRIDGQFLSATRLALLAEPRAEDDRVVADDSEPAPKVEVVALSEDVTGSVRPLAGRWGPDPSACSKRLAEKSGAIPMTISRDAARAGGAACTFKSVQRSGNDWRVVAQCSDGQRRWTSQVKLSLAGARLSWASARGTQTYVRCAARTPVQAVTGG